MTVHTPAGFRKKLALKYALDVLFGWISLLIFSPALLFFVILIKVDGLLRPENAGPSFYTEPRMSEGKFFKIYKFRTVTTKQIAQIREKPGQASITGSSSLTWAGKFILSHYFDEFPQLINIAKGEMSFVGPRPHIEKQAQDSIHRGCVYREFMKAGLFGVPQACKRHPHYEALFRKMAETHKSEELIDRLDALYYMELNKRSSIGIIFFDLWVIMRCFIVILRGTGYSKT